MGLYGTSDIKPDAERPSWKCVNCDRLEVAYQNHLPQKCPSCQSSDGWQAVNDLEKHFEVTSKDVVRALAKRHERKQENE